MGLPEVTPGVAFVTPSAGVGEGLAQYLSDEPFLVKTGLFALILVLEIRPRITVLGWKRRLRRNELVDTRRAPRLSWLSFVQPALLVLTVFAAGAMERGLFS